MFSFWDPLQLIHEVNHHIKVPLENHGNPPNSPRRHLTFGGPGLLEQEEGSPLNEQRPGTHLHRFPRFCRDTSTNSHRALSRIPLPKLEAPREESDLLVRMRREGGARGSQLTSWFETWTLLFQTQGTAGGSKSSPTAWRCLEVFSSRWTPHLSPLSTQMVSSSRGCAYRWCALSVARRWKERRYPELSGHNNRCRLVVLAGEVGGRWSDETRTFIRSLARLKARSQPPLLRKRVGQAWRLWWWSLLSYAAARAFACSFVDLRVPGGADGNLPLACEVEGEQQHAGLV